MKDLMWGIWEITKFMLALVAFTAWCLAIVIAANAVAGV